MDDKKLKALKNIDIPAPSPGAERRAIDSSLAAFEAAHKKSAPQPQGFSNLIRLIHSFTQRTGNWIMNRRMMVGAVASTVLLVPLAAHFAFEEGLIGRDLLDGWRHEPKPPVTSKLKNNEKLAKPDEIKTNTGPASELRDKITQLRKSEQEKTGKKISSDDKRIRALVPPPPADASPLSVLPGVMQNKRVQTYSPSTAYRRNPGRLQRNFALARRHNAPMAGYARKHRKPYSLHDRDIIGSKPQAKTRDKFPNVAANSIKQVSEHPVSTFSIDVDTASYAFVRRMLKRGALPSKTAVRIEEMINYFPYAYQGPEDAKTPFKSTMTIYPTPWNAETKLLHIGIKGHQIAQAKFAPKNLVFLIDVSGSMRSADKLPLLKSAFRLLVGQLGDNDTVSIVTYAGRSATVLQPTSGKNKLKILSAIDNLNSGGSTAGAAGIQQAYALAQASFKKNGVNRIILATDGDFNVGISSTNALKDFIETKRKTGVSLSVLGFGQGNLNDALMQALAQNGNGNAAHIDTLNEARKVLVEEAGSMLNIIAKDVKIQIEFNPAMVSEYRLIGYETRALKRQDFNNDKIDAGEIGSGHTVTAIYEITPVGAKKSVDNLRYKKAKPIKATGNKNEYGFLKLRYKLPKETKSKLVSMPITRALEVTKFSKVPLDVRFATSVAAFGQKLKRGTRIGDFSFDDIIKIAMPARGADPFGYRSEFLSLVRLAKSLVMPGKKQSPQTRR